MQKAVTRPRVHRSCKLTTSHQSPSREKVSWALPVALCGARTGAPSDDAPFFRTLCTEVTSHPFCFILFYLLKAGPGRRHTRGRTFHADAIARLGHRRPPWTRSPCRGRQDTVAARLGLARNGLPTPGTCVWTPCARGEVARCLSRPPWAQEWPGGG